MIVIWTVTCIPTDAQMALSPHLRKALAVLCRLSGDAPPTTRRPAPPEASHRALRRFMYVFGTLNRYAHVYKCG